MLFRYKVLEIASMLRQRGFQLVAEPMSFLRSAHSPHPSEDEEAEHWGATLAKKAATVWHLTPLR